MTKQTACSAGNLRLQILDLHVASKDCSIHSGSITLTADQLANSSSFESIKKSPLKIQ